MKSKKFVMLHTEAILGIYFQFTFHFLLKIDKLSSYGIFF